MCGCLTLFMLGMALSRGSSTSCGACRVMRALGVSSAWLVVP